MKLRIAMWTSPAFPPDKYTAIWSDAMEHALKGQVRRTEYVEVDLPELKVEDTIDRDLAILTEMEKGVLVESNQELQAIKDQRAKLLAITDARASA